MKYQTQINKTRYDAVVIGAGISGLVCAVDLARAGLSVLVLEQHYQPGGMTSTFKRKGFTFEAGGHRVTGIKQENAPLFETLQGIGQQLRLVPVRPSYAAFVRDRRIEGDLDLKKYRENLTSLFPDRKSGIDAFLTDMLEIKEAGDYIESLGGPPDLDVLASKHPLFVKYLGKTTGEFIRDRFARLEPDLIFFLTLVGTYTTLPLEEQNFATFAKIWTSHHTGEGMSLMVGGTPTLIDLLLRYIDARDGQVVVNQRVDRVMVEDGRAVGVVARGGNEVRAGVVISAASDEQTYLKMLDPGSLPDEFVRRIKNKRPSGAVFQVYLGIEDGPGLENVSTFVFPGTEPIHDRVKNWDIEAITSSALISVQGREMSPQGYRAVNISCPCPYEHPDGWFIRGEDRTGYRAFKDEMARRIIRNMARYIPDLESRITVMETATPLTMERYTLATAGGIHGLANIPEQSGPFRGPITTPLPGLYHVGQYVFPGGGIYPCSISGKLGAKTVLADHFS
ncbi:MAG: NAD(P)/FAD-dependent oxidoreductase [Proteobacteria bacterium]|nr:NAD(P)/FAD-dependent oxidoreductase [Pseudomonadota bacterium]